MRNSTLRPVLRYHGGKFMLAPWIISHFPPHRIYCEPFGGAASVLMRKPRAYADVYNDLDGDIVNVFRVLRDEKLSAKLCRQIKLTPYARAEFKAAYGDVTCPVERARRIIAISFMGFGSAAHNRQHRTGFRGTAMRNGTTPAMDWASWPNAIELLHRAAARRHDREPRRIPLIPRHDSARTLYYVDPPYPLETRGMSNQRQKHYSHELDTSDHERLADCCIP
jgi:DNA adenine methylase